MIEAPVQWPNQGVYPQSPPFRLDQLQGQNRQYGQMQMLQRPSENGLRPNKANLGVQHQLLVSQPDYLHQQRPYGSQFQQNPKGQDPQN